MATLQERIETATENMETNQGLLHDIVHGGPTETVETEGGSVPTVAKKLADLDAAYAAAGAVAACEAERTAAEAARGLAETERGLAETAADAAHDYALAAAAAVASVPALATEAQAISGTDNDAYMTALRTAQAIAALSASGSETITAGENLADRDLIYQDVFNQRGGGATLWYKIDADATAPVRISPRVGIALEAISSAASGSAQVRSGRVDGFTGLTVGGLVWASATAGGVTQTAPAVPASGTQTASRLVGIAASATEIDFTPEAVTTFIARNSALTVGSSVVVNHWTDGGARERVPHAYVAAGGSSAIAQGTGTAIGNMTENGGIAAAFDGNANQGHTSCATKSGTTGFVGKTYSGGKRVIKAVAVGSNNYGFIYDGASVTLTLRGSDSAAAYGGGTSIATTTVSDASLLSVTLEGANASTYANYWVDVLSSSGSENFCYCAELTFYEYSATRDEPVRIGSATIDSAATDCITVKFADASDANQDTNTTFINRSGAPRDVIVEVAL
ncbi:hypothetical protein [Oleispirillum naphthae]|uniref:hypothetical protein n=1 Tax=Oleispirillum naphthae TaxID=2838853 RepID=UPI0030825300